MIKSIKIEVQGQEIELSLEEAKELKADLDELLGVKQIEYVPTYPYYPWWHVQPEPQYVPGFTTPWSEITWGYGTSSGDELTISNDPPVGCGHLDSFAMSTAYQSPPAEYVTTSKTKGDISVRLIPFPPSVDPNVSTSDVNVY